MRPSILYEALATDTPLAGMGLRRRIFEDMSLDERPASDGPFIVISFAEFTLSGTSVLEKGPRNIIVAVHQPWLIGRDFTKVNAISNRITKVYSGISQQIGSDGVRVCSIRLRGKTANRSDPGWETITQATTYGVLYNESDL